MHPSLLFFILVDNRKGAGYSNIQLAHVYFSSVSI
jgi:hypothetical protein